MGFNEYVLQPGDAVSLDSTTPHRLVNDGDTPVHAIWFVEGRDPHDAAQRRRSPGE
jgi:quercetin dioxygenase-like cupin family protein